MRKLMTVLIGALLAVSVQAQALTITPATTPQYTGPATGMPEIFAEIAALGIVLGSELYKQDVGGPESGPFSGSYTTAFFNTPTDPKDATITHDPGTPVMTDANYLLVKDGKQNPAWYLFDLSNLTDPWNGTDVLEIMNFWPEKGAISHVSLYGTSNPVPEPGTMMLLGFGMFGLAIFGKRRMNK